MMVACSIAQAKAFLHREAQHSTEDAAVKTPLCCDFHSSSDEEQLAQMSRPVTSSTRYVNLFRITCTWGSIIIIIIIIIIFIKWNWVITQWQWLFYM